MFLWKLIANGESNLNHLRKGIKGVDVLLINSNVCLLNELLEVFSFLSTPARGLGLYLCVKCGRVIHLSSSISTNSPRMSKTGSITLLVVLRLRVFFAFCHVLER